MLFSIKIPCWKRKCEMACCWMLRWQYHNEVSYLIFCRCHSSLRQTICRTVCELTFISASQSIKTEGGGGGATVNEASDCQWQYFTFLLSSSLLLYHTITSST
jgi:hypothetical protein